MVDSGEVFPVETAWLPIVSFFFFQAEDGIRDLIVTGVQTCALPISPAAGVLRGGGGAAAGGGGSRALRHAPHRRPMCAARHPFPVSHGVAAFPGRRRRDRKSVV